MSDLISRSELLKAFNNKNVQITYDLPVEEVLGEDVDLDDFAMLVQDAIQAYKKMVIDTIKNQPTAYSDDRVVEELREFLINYGVSENSRVHQRIIEIVKQCGVSDDVCEWKYTKEIMDNAEFKVGCNQNALKRGIVPNNFSYHDFKYCPYCGKKIKVVE